MDSFLSISILGTIQGFTEFLPISSSGHIAITNQFLKFSESNLFLNIWLHFGSFLALLTFYHRDLFSLKKAQSIIFNIDGRKEGAFVILGVLPIILMGPFLEKKVDLLMDSTMLIGIAFIMTSIFLWGTKYKNKNDGKLSYKAALIIGISQVLAILPGVSRAGITIGCALYLGISGKKAAQFSFRMAIILIFGAMVYKLFQSGANMDVGITPMTLIGGLVVSYITSLIAIKTIFAVIKKKTLHWFSPYLIALGTICILYGTN